MTTAVADDVFAEIRRKRESVDWHAMARAVAHGEVVDAAQLDYLLVINHKTLDDFESLVSSYRRREEKRQEYSRLAELRAEQAKLRSQIIEANEELERAVAKHRETTWPLQSEIRRLQQEVQELERIPRELREACPDGRLDERQAELRIRSNAIMRQVSDAERQLRSQQAALSNAAERARIKLSNALNSEWLGHSQFIDLAAEIEDDDPLASYKRRVLTAARALKQVRDRQDNIREESDKIHRRQYEL